MLYLVCFLAFGPDLATLSDDEWHAREGAQERLRRALPFIGPWVVYEVERAPWGVLRDPEGMRRARELMGEWRAIGSHPKCLLEVLGAPYRTLRYFPDSDGWYESWDGKPRGEFARKQAHVWGEERDPILDPARRYVYYRYLYPLRVSGTDAQWWWDDTRVATRRLAADLLDLGVPKPVIRCLLYDD